MINVFMTYMTRYVPPVNWKGCLTDAAAVSPKWPIMCLVGR